MEPADLTIEILKGIREEGRKTNERLGALAERVDAVEKATINGFGALTQRVDGLEKATINGFVAVTARLENIRDFAGERYRDHEERLRRVEKRLDAVEGTHRGP